MTAFFTGLFQVYYIIYNTICRMEVHNSYVRKKYEFQIENVEKKYVESQKFDVLENKAVNTFLIPNVL